MHRSPQQCGRTSFVDVPMALSYSPMKILQSTTAAMTLRSQLIVTHEYVSRTMYQIRVIPRIDVAEVSELLAQMRSSTFNPEHDFEDLRSQNPISKSM